MRCFKCGRNLPLDMFRFVKARKHKHHICYLCLKEPKPKPEPKCQHELKLQFTRTIRQQGKVLEIYNEYICGKCNTPIYERYNPRIGWVRWC